MRDVPILMSPAMVRATLREIEQPGSGKTQTRRVINPQPSPDFIEATIGADGMTFRPAALFGSETHKALRRLYRPGDRLYVREAWRSVAPLDDTSPKDMADLLVPPIRYEADGESVNWKEWRGHDAGRFRQGMHMPRWASRITLIVTEVRVQRLQEIIEADAWAEGVEDCGEVDGGRAIPGHGRDLFQSLWDSLNADRGFGWDANPWVAAYTFRPILGNIDYVQP